MPLYDDDGPDYGDSVYGDESPAIKSIRNRVGPDFDLAINGVGLKLIPDKKAYDKKAAQTFSYNPKSLFKQGDGASLVSKDLYYWARLEHSRWDGGETYDPWKPGDTTDPNRRDTHYASSLGFDTTDPFKLSHLREMYVSPSYEFVVSNDGPLAYWILGDHPASTEAYDQISNDRTPGTPYGGVIEGIAPPPIVNDPNTVDLFNGTDAIIKTAKRVPFAGNHTAGAWSLEAWAAPALLPQKGIIAAVGNELDLSGVGSYAATIAADNPVGWWRLGNAGDPFLDSNAAHNDLHYNGAHTLLVPQDDTIPSATGDDNDPLLFEGPGDQFLQTAGINPVANTYNLQTNFSMECWYYSLGNGTYADDQGLILNWGEPNTTGFPHTPVWGMGIAGRAGVGGTVTAFGIADHHLYLQYGFVFGTDHFRDTGYLVNLGVTGWYHFVMVYSGGSLGTWHFYVNGVQVGSWNATEDPQNSEREGFIVGGPSSGGTMASGDIADVAVYDSPLTAVQVATHYAAATGGVAGGGGFAFGIASTDGSTTGDELMIRLPGVGWIDTTYAFAYEMPTSGWTDWWAIDLPIRPAEPYELVPVPNVWHHIVAASTGTQIKVYVDGVLKATLNNTQLTTDAYASIGGMRKMNLSLVDTGAEWFFNGQIAQVAVYNVQLTGAQVLAHYNAGSGGTGATLVTAGQTYARFIETFDGRLYINQKTTKINTSHDGGVSWAAVTLPDGDVTNITVLGSRGDKVYVATATNIYLGDYSGFTKINGVNPTIPAATALLYYSGQLYIGKGTSLYYVDPATGIITQLYDTKSFAITFIEAFQGKIWFGGSAGRQTKVWTWTNNTLPPSPANGVGAQLQDGTIPYGFVVQSSLVYLNTLLLGGLIAGDSTSEGQGAVYYIEPVGNFGQLLVIGPPMNQVRGSGVDYGIRSMWGAEDKLWVSYNTLTGMGVYNFVTGGFATHSRTTKYTTATVIAICRVNGRNIFVVGDDGNAWREGDNKVGTASVEESEFRELPFIPKIIDGIEGLHSPLNTGEQVEVQISYDEGVSWTSLGANKEAGDITIDFPLVNTLANHWRTKLVSYRGGNATKAPEIKSHSVRFAPRNSFRHEWVIEALVPTRQRTKTGFILTDPGSKLIAELWEAYEEGVVVEFIDRNRKTYKCMVLFFEEGRDRFEPARVQAGQLNLAPSIHCELLEVEKLG